MIKLFRLFIYLLLCLGLMPFLFNSTPIVVIHNSHIHVPPIQNYYEDDFGGEHHILMDYTSPYGQSLLSQSTVIKALYPFGLLPDITTAHNLAPPSFQHWLGTNSLGQDILAYTLYAFLFNSIIALTLAALSTLLGTLLGCLFAIQGGNIDIGGQWLKEICRSIPFVLILVVTKQAPFYYFLVLFLLTQWTRYATIARTYTLKLMQHVYIQDALHQGMPLQQVFRKHIYPQVSPMVLSQVPHSFIGYLTLTQSLAYFGINLAPSLPSLGVLIQQAQQHPHSLSLLLGCTVAFSTAGFMTVLYFDTRD